MPFYAPADFEPDRSAGYLARRIHQLNQAGLESVFGREGITSMQWAALVSIYFARATTCAEIARDLSYDKGATTRLVDGLAANGWITRDRDDGDRRVVNLALTTAGSEMADRVRDKVVDRWNEWLEGWERADVEVLIAMLQRLRDTLTVATTAATIEGQNS